MIVLPQAADSRTNDKAEEEQTATLRMPSLFTALWEYARQCSASTGSAVVDDIGIGSGTIASVIDDTVSGKSPVYQGSVISPYAVVANAETAYDPGIDIDRLVSTASDFPCEGLVLTTAQNTWKEHPLSHDDIVRCVVHESFSDPDWFGASVVSEVNDEGNIHGNDECYVSWYEAFFFVQNPGEWSFATDSDGASEIAVDGEAVAAWYGDHSIAGDWSHSGTVILNSGWHRFSYYHVVRTSMSCVAKAVFKKPGDPDWMLLSTADLVLKPVNLDDGILLTTKRNTWTSVPENHEELFQCVEADAIKEAGWFGSSIVDVIDQEENIHGSSFDYISLYECFFLAENAETWQFTVHASGASEIEIDEQVVVSRYGTGVGLPTGAVDLSYGWHRFVMRHAGGREGEAVSIDFSTVGDNGTRPFSLDELSLKGTCYLGVDGDSLPASVEAILGTHPALSDTDCDTLDDYYEVKNGLDPLETDSNGDGLSDLVETDGVALDLDGDTRPNVWDRDNDNDNVPDGLDISPFSKTALYEEFDLNIATKGNPLYIDFQIRPENPNHLTLSLRDWDWPDYDREGQILGIPGLNEDIHIFPMLELDASYFPDGDELDRYGIVIRDGKASIPLVPLEDNGQTVALQGRMFYPQTAEPLSLTGKLVWNVFSKTTPDYYRILDENGNCLNMLDISLGQWGHGYHPDQLGLNFQYPCFNSCFWLTLEIWDDQLGQKWQVSEESYGFTIINSLTGYSLTVDDPSQWQIELIEEGDSQPIAWYPETFIITGFNVEESYAGTAEAGLFYTAEYDQTVAAATAAQKEYLYSQLTITEAGETFSGYGLGPFSSVIKSYNHFDLVRADIEDLTNQALASMGSAKPELPILWLFQNTYARQNLDDLVSDSYILDDNCVVDLTAIPGSTYKTQRVTWYDTETCKPLAGQQLLEMLDSWGWQNESIASTGFAFLTWGDGLTAITNIGDEAIYWGFPDAEGWDPLSIADCIVGGTGLAIVDTSCWFLGAGLEIGAFAANKGSSLLSLCEFLGTGGTVLGPIMTLGGLGIDTAFSIANAYATYQQLGGQGMAGHVCMMMLTANLLVKSAFAALHLVAWAIGLIPGIGWIIAAAIEGILWSIQLSDWITSLICGKGWMQMIWEVILKKCTDLEAKGTPRNIKMNASEPDITDPDGNGLDPADSIIFSPRFTWDYTCSDFYDYVYTYFWPSIAQMVGGEYSKGDYPSQATIDHSTYSLVVKSLGGDSLPKFLKLPGEEYFHKQRLTITPKKSMINMPVEMPMIYTYTVCYTSCFKLFGLKFNCHDGISKATQTIPSTLYFDVLPGSIKNFITWREIQPLDSDGDGLTDIYEASIGSNPKRCDTDMDFAPDKYEIDNGLDPMNSDTDGDQILDGLELYLKTDPLHPDTDRDGLTDLEEYTGWQIGFTYHEEFYVEHVWSDPLSPDGDLDGLSDLDEFHKFNPRSKDSDGNGILDAEDSALDITSILSEDIDGDGLTGQQEIDGWDAEVIYGESVIVSEHYNSSVLLPDTDFDGMDDSQELRCTCNPRSPDTDADGLGDATEAEVGTNPVNYDTDGDFLDDGSEIYFGSDALTPDTDVDGLSDYVEFGLGSDPLKPDTDDDGLSDFEEVTFGSNLLKPDSDEDTLLDFDEYELGTDPWNPDTDGDNLSDGYEMVIGTDPLNIDTDGDTLTDEEELMLWTDPLDADTDDDMLTDGEEIKDYGTNAAFEDTDNDGITDDLDEDTYTPHISEVTVIYDEYDGRVYQFINDLSQYTQVNAGTWDAYGEYLDDEEGKEGYFILIGNPDTNRDVWHEIEYLIGDVFDDPDLLSRMESSDRYRFATITDRILTAVSPIIPPAKDNQAIVLLTRPYPTDHWRALAMLKSLQVEVLENGVKVTYSEPKETLTLDAINQIGCSVYAELTEQVPSMGAQISVYNESTTPHNLTSGTGLVPGEIPVGKYVDIWLSASVQDLASGVDRIDEAVLKIYYTTLDMDGTPGKDGDCTDPSDIDESTLCLYYWDEAQGFWVKLSDGLDWVNSVNLNTTNVTSIDTEFEGCITAQTSHLSLFALAGKPRPVNIASISPGVNATNVPLDQSVNVTYDGNIRASDLTSVTVSPNISDMTVTLDESTDSLIIGHALFSYRTEYTVIVPDGVVEDVYGNPSVRYSWTFTTISGGSNGVTEERDPAAINIYPDSSGCLRSPLHALSEDGKVEIDIETGTTCLVEGKPFNRITINEVNNPSSLPDFWSFVGVAYEFEPDSATFDPPITLTFTYDSTKLPDHFNEEKLFIASWDPEKKHWVRLEGQVDPHADTITITTSHFSAYAIIMPSRPAEFTVDDLVISPIQVQTGQPVNISVTVANVGDLAGDYNVALKLNDALQQTKTITLDGNDSLTVSFSLTVKTAGMYTLSIGPAQSTFTVEELVTTSTPSPTPTQTQSVLDVTPEPTPTVTTTKPVIESDPTGTVAAAGDENVLTEKDSTSKDSSFSIAPIIVGGIVVIALITILLVIRKRKN